MTFPRRSLEELADSIDYGVTASANAAPVGPKFLRITDIQDDRVDWASVPYCSVTPAEADGARLSPGDIVFARTGATTGKSYLLKECPAGVVFASYLIRVRPRPANVDPRYLAWFFQTPDYWRQITSSASGTAQPGVNATKLKSLSVPTPPLLDQRHVANILDAADMVRRKRRQTIALTEELLRSAFLEIFGDPVTNPKGWPVKPLGDLLAEIESGWSPICLARPASTEEWGVLKLGAVTTGRFIGTENKAMDPATEAIPELEVRPGDVLFARKNTYEHVAACVLVEEVRPRLTLPDLLFRLVPSMNAPLGPITLWGTLSHPGKRKQVQSLAGGTAGSMPNISKARLRGVELPVPPKDVQARFEKAVARCNSVRAHAEAALCETERLFGALVQRAFRGELTGARSKRQLGLFGEGARDVRA